MYVVDGGTKKVCGGCEGSSVWPVKEVLKIFVVQANRVIIWNIRKVF